MYNILEYINTLNVPLDGTVRMDCPVCKSYKTFTVTNNMGTMLWNCFKASCNVGGNARVRLSVDDIKGVNKKVDNKEEFVLPEYVVPHDNRTGVLQFCTKWDINPNKLNLHYDVKEDRVVFPIMEKDHIVDATGRAIGSRLPKWKRYGNNTLPYFHGCGKVAVVVEDCVSAAAIGSEIYVGVAILGTSLSEEHKKFLSQFSTAIIALDPDALPKTFLFAKELRGYVEDIRVLRLEDDLKYFKEQDILNLYNLTPKEKNYGVITTTEFDG
tara:strand:- start:18903 stop:19709 length:807 start_codon:yes stop_codon:yes gene_type:complete